MIGLTINGLAAMVNIAIYSATGNMLCLYMAGASLVIALGCAIADGGR